MNAQSVDQRMINVHIIIVVVVIVVFYLKCVKEYLFCICILHNTPSSSFMLDVHALEIFHCH